MQLASRLMRRAVLCLLFVAVAPALPLLAQARVPTSVYTYASTSSGTYGTNVQFFTELYGPPAGSGGTMYYYDGSNVVCAITNPASGWTCATTALAVGTHTITAVYSGTYYNGVTYLGSTSEPLSVVITGLSGYLDLKYLVVGVTYAPPGQSGSTFVDYTKSSFFGTTASFSKSFKSSASVSISVKSGFSALFGVLSGSVTNSYSASGSQESTNSTSLTTSFNISQGEQTYGTGSYWSPVDSDYDLVWVWLNPVIAASVQGSAVTLNGYGYNESDQNGLDIVPIPVGYLNGDFGSITSWDQYPSLQRSWASSQSFPTGQGPALNSTDFATIAKADPFSSNSYGTSEIGYVPPAPSTADGRFTASACTSQSSINYDQASPSQTPAVASCTLTYTNLTTQAQGLTTTNSQTFSTDLNVSASFLASLSVDLASSSTLTWTTNAQKSITTSTTSTAGLSVQGPPCNNVVSQKGPCVPIYSGPTQFNVYQDNMYGTFMFAPIHYF